MRRRFAVLPAAAIAAALATLAPVATQPVAAASPTAEAQMLALIQQARADNGLPPLIVSAGLTRAAQNWSDYELGANTSYDDPNPGAFLAPWWLAWGEDSGRGPGGVQALFNAFMASPPHRANILGNYNRIGVGVSLRGDGWDFVELDFELFPPGY